MTRLRHWVLGLAVLLTCALVAQAQSPTVNSTLQNVFTLVWEASTTKPTYAATQALTTASSPTDVCTLSGSTSKLVRVRRVIVAGSNTAVAAEPVSIIKRSTANTVATGVAMVAVPYDSTSAASSVTMAEAWTANPTLGTTVGTLADVFMTYSTITNSAPAITFEFGRLGSAAVLRGSAQTLAVNLNAQLGAATVSCTFEWTEE